MRDVGVALQNIIDGTLDVFLFGNNVIEVNHCVAVVHVDFRTDGRLEEEVHVILVLKVIGLLVVKVVERIANHVEFIVEDIFVEVFGNHVVQGFHFRVGAIHFLNHAHGNHARTEAGHVGALAHLLEGLFDVFLVISFLDADFDGDQVLSFLSLCDVHF